MDKDKIAQRYQSAEVKTDSALRKLGQWCGDLADSHWTLLIIAAMILLGVIMFAVLRLG